MVSGMKSAIKVLLIISVLVSVGCSRQVDVLPAGATNIRDIGNGWVYFDLDGRTFLFFRTNWDGGKGAMITQVK